MFGVVNRANIDTFFYIYTLKPFIHLKPFFMKLTILRQLLMLAMLLSNVVVNAQNIIWGTPISTKTPEFIPNIIGEDPESVFATSREYENLFLEKYSKTDLKRIYSRKIETPEIDNKKLDYEGIYYNRNAFAIFASYYDKGASTMNLYAYKYDGETGKATGKPRLIMTVPVEKKKLKGNFIVFLSDDRSKLLVNHTGYYKDEKCWRDRFVLLNDDMETLTEREDKLFRNEIDFSTSNWIIDNNGSVYYLKKTSGGDVFVVSYDADHDYEKWEAPIDLSDLDRDSKIHNYRFTLTADNDLMMVGFYSTDGNYLKGTFAMKIRTQSKEIVSKKVNVFDTPRLRELMVSNSIGSTKNPKIGINVYNQINLLKTKDGGFIMLAEGFESYNTAISLFDVIVLAHNSEGEIVWTQKIPKVQIYNSQNLKFTQDPYKTVEFMSYFPAIQGDKLLIYLNDKKKNATRSREDLAKWVGACNVSKMKATAPVCYSIDLKNGETKKSLMPGKLVDVYFKPALSYQFQYDSDVIFIAQWQRKMRFGIMKSDKVL